MGCMECSEAIDKCYECIIYTSTSSFKAINKCCIYLNSLFEDEKENQIEIIDDSNTLEEKRKKGRFKFNYLILNDTLEKELQKILKDSVDKKEIELNTNNVFEREDIQKENKNIIIKIKKQLTKYKSSLENYLMKRATFLKKVGLLVRFSHEVAIYIFQSLLIMFKKRGIHSKEAETIRLQFSSWIKELFKEDCFEKISKNENILAQIKNIIENEINSDNEKDFLINMLPDIIKLYFHCFLADIKVNIIYAHEDSKFDPEHMIDILLTGLDDDKNILFTFLPGLFCNGRYFENSYIYVTTYPIDNPNKFQFKKPIFKTIESDITLDTNEINPNLNFYSKEKLKNGHRPDEFVLDPDINLDKTNNYYFYLIESNKQN